MDPGNLIWNNKSPENKPSETNGPSSISSRSDEQEVTGAISDNASPQKHQSNGDDDVSNRNDDVSSQNGVNETVKSLTEKLQAALLNITAKEELVLQHAKVAEEAVAGWEQAEIEVSNLKQQLELISRKNISLEDQISHLDTALKECVRQLRQSRDEQESKIRELVSQKSREWESLKCELQSRERDLRERLQAFEKENTDLKGRLELIELERDLSNQSRDEQLEYLQSSERDLSERLWTFERESTDLKARLELIELERDLSNQAAEAASKQHLESVKKITRIEAECRRLRSLNSRGKITVNPTCVSSIYVESVTDSQSDHSGDRAICTDSDAGCPDSWANALIAELDQFKNEKSGSRNLNTSVTNSVEIDLMDDFLEMERLVALPETKPGLDQSNGSGSASGPGSEALNVKLRELQERIEKVENEKLELVEVLEDSRNQIELSEAKLLELELQLELANESKQVYLKEIQNLEGQREKLVSQLESTLVKVKKMSEEILFLEEKVESLETIDSEKVREERAKSEEIIGKLGVAELARRELEAQVKKLQEEVSILEERIGAERESKEFLESKLESIGSSYLEKEKEERAKSEEIMGKLETAELARKELECRLEMANLEMFNLRNKTGLLEAKLEEERSVSEDFEAKCRKLEAQLEKLKILNSNGDLKIKQEKELAMAAGKLAECQKTIASLGRQLKSLTNLEDSNTSTPLFLNHNNTSGNGEIISNSMDELDSFTLLPNGDSQPRLFFSGFNSINSSNRSSHYMD